MIPEGDRVTLELTQIQEPHQALRGPERHDPKYHELRESIREKGVYTPILVRPDGDGYILIDGMQRFTISKEVGRRTIPARVLDVTPEEALEIQIIANVHRIETTPVQYAEQIRLMMTLRPDLTLPQVAVKLGKSPNWIKSMLRLVNLEPDIAAIVESGKITVWNAQALAKLPPKEQREYLVMAQNLKPAEFSPKINAIARKLKEGRKGDRVKKFVQVDHFQKMSSVRDEIRHGAVRKELFRICGKVTPARAFRLALEWVLHRDPISVQKAKDKESKLLAAQSAREQELKQEAAHRRAC